MKKEIPDLIPKDFMSARYQRLAFRPVRRAFCQQFGVISGRWILFKAALNSLFIKRAIYKAMPDLPRGKDPQNMIQMAAMMIALFKSLNRDEATVQATIALLKKILVEPLATYIIDSINPKRDIAFASFTSLAKWGFNLFEGIVASQTVRDDETAYAFDVTGCRFVEIFNAMGCREAAPLMCAMDSAMYAGMAHVTLKRTNTLALGGTKCDFVFQSITVRALD